MKLRLPTNFHQNIFFPLFITAAILKKGVNGEGSGSTTLSGTGDLCGQVLSSGSYTLVSSVDCDGIGSNGSGLTLTGTASLDCQGGTISSGGTPSSVGAVVQDSSSVTNCIFENFEIGVILDDSAGSRSLSNVQSNNNDKHGVFITGTGDNVLTDVTANGNSVHGFLISGSGTNMFTNVAAGNNIYYGFMIENFPGSNTFSGLVSNGNSQGVFIKRDVTGTNVINDSNILSNRFHGYVTQARDGDTTISGGIIQGSGRHGILSTRYGATGNLLITDLQILGNTGTGVVFSGSQSATIQGSLIKGNGDNGIFVRYAQPTIDCLEISGNTGSGIHTSSDIAISNSLVFENEGGNFRENQKSVVTADDNVCLTAEDCATIDIATDCAAFPLLEPPIVIMDASGVCNEQLGEPNYVLSNGMTIDCGTRNGPTLTGNTVLNCNGGSLVGVTDQRITGVSLRDNASMRNCKIVGFNTGINLPKDYPGDKVLTNVEVTGSADRGLIMRGDGSLTITDSKFIGNSHTGIDTTGTGDKTLTNVISNGNGSVGILFRGGSDGTMTMTNVVANDNNNGGISMRGEGTFLIDGATVIGNRNYGIAQFLFDVAEIPPVVTIRNAEVRNNEKGMLLKEAVNSLVEGTVITGSTDGSGFRWRGEVTVNCVEISRNANRGFSEDTNNPANLGMASVDNALIYENGDNNVRSRKTALGNVYACDAGPQTDGDPNTGDLRNMDEAPTNDFANVVCDEIRGASGGVDCGSDCTTTSLASFTSTVITPACAAFPLVG